MSKMRDFGIKNLTNFSINVKFGNEEIGQQWFNFDKNENPKKHVKNWFPTNDIKYGYIRLVILFLSKGVPNLSLKKV